MNQRELFKSIQEDRKAALEKILNSETRHKLIVAGAGTGKSHTFKELLKKNGGNGLALTFINNLASDMTKDLMGLANVKTFHSFCKHLLHKIPTNGIDGNFYFFPKLNEIITADAKILKVEVKNPKTSLTEAFQLLNEDTAHISFFINRANYYNAVGFDDSVYRVLLIFRNNPDIIPQYTQIVIDEFQDFNPLEVEFITHLESKNLTLIVGDDDQAIYAFKKASPIHLREKTKDPKYDQFSLLYCSRCPHVIVETTNFIINKAKQFNLLNKRIEKEYKCYLPDKHQDNEKYPKIIHAVCTVQRKNAPYIAQYIEKIMNNIPSNEILDAREKNYPLGLVIGPSHYLKQIFDYLKNLNFHIVYKNSPSSELNKFDGYRCLLNNERSNLGWRILSELHKNQISEKDIKAILEKTMI